MPLQRGHQVLHDLITAQVPFPDDVAYGKLKERGNELTLDRGIAFIP